MDRFGFGPPSVGTPGALPPATHTTPTAAPSADSTGEPDMPPAIPGAASDSRAAPLRRAEARQLP